VERLGIERTWEAVREADCVLQLVDAREAQTPGPEPGRGGGAPSSVSLALAAEREAGLPWLFVCNKCDLLTAGIPDDTPDTLWLSAATGEGIDRLRARLLVVAGGEPGAESTFIARERHLQALGRSDSALAAAKACLAQGNAALELLAEELRLAQQALGEITGELTADALLGEIFSRFCIGK
jgi:tRNA modification GTPase